MSIDPRSDRIALYYTGNAAGEPSVSLVPARDLTENDIARLLVERHGSLPSGAALSGAADKLLDSLTEGPYRRTKPSTSADSPAAKPKE